jgi:multisubunit Na+/H+ antiporter MnhC subunit
MHVVNRVLATLLALALLVGGLLAVVEIVLAQLGRPSWLVPHEQWSSGLAGQTFIDPVVRAVLIGLVVLGLALLVLALRRGKPRSVRLPSRNEGVRVSASRRGIERSLSTAARRADGVRAARAKAGRRTVRVKAVTALRSTGDLQEPVATAVTGRLEQLGLGGILRPRVSIKKESSR